MPLDVVDAARLLSELATEMDDLRPGFDLLGSYYDGLPPWPMAPSRLTRTYTDLMRMSRSNWCRLVVDVVAERLVVGSIRSSRDADQDEGAWAIWEANNLDAGSVLVHTEALKLGCCYAMVWPTGDGVRITGEHPTQVHVRYAAVGDDYGEAAVKLWLGRNGYLYGTLYDREAVYRFRSEIRDDATGSYTARRRMPTSKTASWLPRAEDDDGGWLVDNPLGEVPFVKFSTMPDLLGGYCAEITPIVPIQNRITKTIFDRMVAQEFSAFPQKWVTGIDVPTDPETGNPREPFNAAVDRLWVSSSPDTAFGQFPATTADAYLRAVEADVQSLATQSRTPPHYLTGGMGQFPSGESVRATEYGLSQKVKNRQTTYGEAWGNVVRLAARAAKDETLAADDALTVVWADVEARSEGEVVDALLKMSTLGVPPKVLWERWGASPDEAKRWAAEAAEIAAAAPPAATVPPEQQPKSQRT